MTSEIAWRQCRSGQAGIAARQPAEEPIHKRLTLWAKITILSLNSSKKIIFTSLQLNEILLNAVRNSQIYLLLHEKFPSFFSEITYSIPELILQLLTIDFS